MAISTSATITGRAGNPIIAGAMAKSRPILGAGILDHQFLNFGLEAPPHGYVWVSMATMLF